MPLTKGFRQIIRTDTPHEAGAQNARDDADANSPYGAYLLGDEPVHDLDGDTSFLITSFQ